MNNRATIKDWFAIQVVRYKVAIVAIMILNYATFFLMSFYFVRNERLGIGNGFLHAKGQIVTSMIVMFLVSMRLVRGLIVRDIESVSFKADLISCLGGTIDKEVARYFYGYLTMICGAIFIAGCGFWLFARGSIMVDISLLKTFSYGGVALLGLMVVHGWHAYISLHKDRENLIIASMPAQLNNNTRQRSLGLDLYSGSAAMLLVMIYIWDVNLYYLLSAVLILGAAHLTCLLTIIGIKLLFATSRFMNTWWLSYYRAFFHEKGSESWVRDQVSLCIIMLSFLFLFRRHDYLAFSQLWMMAALGFLLVCGLWYNLRVKILTELGNGSVLFLLGLSARQIKKLLLIQVGITACLVIVLSLGLVLLLRTIHYIEINSSVIINDFMFDIGVVLVVIYLAGAFINKAIVGGILSARSAR